jgi:hypothetical protein
MLEIPFLQGAQSVVRISMPRESTVERKKKLPLWKYMMLKKESVLDLDIMLNRII